MSVEYFTLASCIWPVGWTQSDWVKICIIEKQWVMSFSVLLEICNMEEFFIGYMESTKKDEKLNILVVHDSGGDWRHG